MVRDVVVEADGAVAVTVALVAGLAGASPTVAAGAVLATVTGLEVSGALVAVPSLTVTRTRIRSPLSPLPAVARLSVLPVAPLMSVPLRVHW